MAYELHDEPIPIRREWHEVPPPTIRAPEEGENPLDCTRPPQIKNKKGMGFFKDKAEDLSMA